MVDPPATGTNKLYFLPLLNAYGARNFLSKFIGTNRVFCRAVHRDGDSLLLDLTDISSSGNSHRPLLWPWLMLVPLLWLTIA